MDIPIEKIKPNPRQPRQSIDQQELAGLADSLREHGIIQPLVVSLGPQPGEYILVAGERRLLAARQVGMSVVPALVRETSDQQRLELALVENVQRADLGPLETAEAFHQLSNEFGLSHEEIANRVGKSRTAVTNTLRLLQLPPRIQQALTDGRVTEGHARALLSLPTPQSQTAALATILSNQLNVRQTEELVRKLRGDKAAPRPRAAPDPEIKAIEDRLQAQLGTRVTLRHGRKGGSLTIHYYSNEELEALLSFFHLEDQ
jgi:ParB family chromosome partitioning protein